MAFDALTLAAVRDELAATVIGGVIQRVVLTGELAVGLEIYGQRRKRFLLCSAEPLAARVCLAEDRPVRDSDTPTPFLLLLRKHVRDGRLIEIDQPPYERLLKLRIAKRGAVGAREEVDLIIETMGRRSNVLLVDANGLILDALRRSGPTRNPKRPILPRRPYQEPPAQNRLDPLDPATHALLAEEAPRSGSQPLAELLGQRLAGFSPLAAREAAFRATASASATAGEADWKQVEAAVRGLLEPLSGGVWQPTVSFRDGQVTAFAPYLLSHLADQEQRSLPSISQAIELGFSATTTTARRPQPRIRALAARIDALLAETERKRAALERSLEAAQQAETLKRAGQAVLASLVVIEPGQRQLEFDGQEIQLSPLLTPLENAQRLFRDYRKARDAARQVPALLKSVDFRQRQLAELRVLAELADSPARQHAIVDELASLDESPSVQPAASSAKASRQAEKLVQGRVSRHRTPEGLEVLVGTSGRGNETVTFKLASGDDLWLHARGAPGAHVILRTAGRAPSEDSLAFAARLAAHNSQARAAGRVEVDYTPRKHVRKIPGAPPGLVTYSHEQTVLASSD